MSLCEFEKIIILQTIMGEVDFNFLSIWDLERIALYAEELGIREDIVNPADVHTLDSTTLRVFNKWNKNINAEYLRIRNKLEKITNSSIAKTKELIENFRSKYECYTYTAFNDEYDSIRTVNNLKGYDDSYACMIEVFSDLVEPSNSEYQSDFGMTDEYFDRVKEVKEDMAQMAMEIEFYYKKQNVKVTLSKWNQGCEYGMAMYIWIPYQ